MSEIQESRLMSVKTALDDDELLFYRMHGSEALGQLFEFEVDLLGEEVDIKLEKVLGEPMSVDLEHSDGEVRQFNGYVTQFSQVGSVGNYVLYRARVQPWFWFLTRNSNCRIFQNMTVPDIIKKIFGEYDLADYEESLSESYRTWEYCVQYRESDFDFISRLLEQEGIYYYFKHKDGKNTLVLADSMSAHQAIPGYETIPYFELNNMTAGDRETIHEWNLSLQVQPGAYATTDYDFEKPKTSLMSKLMNPMEHSESKHEVYDFPGEFVQGSDGERYARIRLEELQSSHHSANGKTNARAMVAGALFTLENYLREDQNRQYLVVESHYQLQTHGYGIDDTAEWKYECAFSVVDAQSPYRKAQSTPKPIVQGPQTAVVVGPAGETIWPDKYGRVKVQFHWDREGGNDENSSCWVRVSQNRAGKNWGESYVPHIGHEVIVSFLEGDPDRPIVTGRVYNADNMPPVGLPGGKTQLAMRDQGNNEMIWEGAGDVQTMHFNQGCGNELLLDGNKGKEKVELRDAYRNELIMDSAAESIYLHTPSARTSMTFNNKGMTYFTAASEHKHIGKDSSTSIFGHHYQTVIKNSTTQVLGTYKLDVTSDAIKFTKGATHETKLGAFSSLTVGATSSVQVGASLSSFFGAKITQSKAIAYDENNDRVIKKFEDLKEVIKDVGRWITRSVVEKIGKDLTTEVTGTHKVVSNRTEVETGTLIQKVTGPYALTCNSLDIDAGAAPVDIHGTVSINGNALKVLP